MKQNREINHLLKKELFDQQLKKRRRQKQERKNLIIACLIVMGLIVSGLAIFFCQISGQTKKTIIVSLDESEPKQEKESQDNILRAILPASLKENLLGGSQAPVNILVLGRPGPNYPGSNLTDTIILLRLKADSDSSSQAHLISLPRDFLVRASANNSSEASSGILTKINSLYERYGIEKLKQKVEEITGLKPDHYIIVDLVVVEEIINLVDGLNVYVPQDIYDPFFPGPGYSYDPFIVKAGWRYLDGKTALKYIRTRYTSPNGDFDRMARQQQVLHLLKQKVLSLNLLWDLPVYLKIFNGLKDHIQTDLSLWQMKELWQTAQDIKPELIKHLVIDKKETELMTGGQVMFGQQMASVVYPRAGQENYEEIREYVRKAIKD